MSGTETTYTKPTLREFARFLIPSCLGLFIFLCPVRYHNAWNIPLGVASEFLADLIKPFASGLVTAVVVIAAVMPLLSRIYPDSRITRSRFYVDNFQVSNYYFIVRAAGAIAVICSYFHIGPEFIYGDQTGGQMLSLLGTLIAWFLVASFLIPLLMNYGIMEYIGIHMRLFTKPLFKLPGRATIDLLASWVGNCNVGVVLTTSQYERGLYTAREAIVIATCFSAASLPFCLVIAGLLNVANNFFLFYLILSITGILATIIMVRIPPLSKYPDTFYEKTGRQNWENTPSNLTTNQWAITQAIKTAKKGPDFPELVIEGFYMFSGIIFSLAPIVMAYGTLALILANHTPVFQILSLPFGYYMHFMGVEEAFKAAPATIVGFADMIIPAILGASITSYETRFIIGILSLVQIIYMTEVGTLILTSKLPIKLIDLIVLFLVKTIIALPIIVFLTKLVGL